MTLDQDLLAELFRENHRSLHRYAVVLTGDRPEADDLVQAVYVRLAGRGLDDVENPAAFAMKAVTNEFLSRRRSINLRRPLDEKVRRWTRTDFAASEESGAVERVVLARALAGLSRRERVAVTLRYLCDVDDTTIAEHLGCTPSTVRSLVARALPRLKRRLIEWEND